MQGKVMRRARSKVCVHGDYCQEVTLQEVVKQHIEGLGDLAKNPILNFKG